MFETLTGRVAPRVPLPRRADASVRMDRIMVLERRIAAMQAEQAGLVAEHATEWIEAGGERGVAAEVGLARGVSVAAAEHQLATALRLTARLPRLYELACRGEISWAGASAVCRETYEVEDDRILAEVDRRLAATVERGAAEWWPLPEGLGLIDQPRTCVEIVAGVPRVVRLPQLRPQPATTSRLKLAATSTASSWWTASTAAPSWSPTCRPNRPPRAGTRWTTTPAAAAPTATTGRSAS